MNSLEISIGTNNEKKELTLNAGTYKGEVRLNAHSGKNGSSAYEVAVENGFSGTEEEWLLSLKGEKGDKGDSGREIKASVVIGHSENGATLKTCDFIYSDGDDFCEVFASSQQLAQSIGVGRVEILEGVYKAKSTVEINVCEVVGIGRVEILPYYGEEQSGSLLHLSEGKCFLENLCIAKPGGINTVNEGDCEEVYMNRMEILGNVSAINTKVHLENSTITGALKIFNSSNSYLLNSEIGSIDSGILTKDCIITGCRIGQIPDMPESNMLRNNMIGGEIQKLSIKDSFPDIKFGRITTNTAQSKLVRTIDGKSFEIYVNEDSNMKVSLYTGGSTPAKTLTSDVFIFLSGGSGDDVVDGKVYQKTLILYMKTTLGMPSIGKWIAASGSDVHENVKIEIECPANTYRGVIKNETQEILLG